jgi:outer membrane protein
MNHCYKYLISLAVLLSILPAFAQEKVWTLDDCIAYALHENIRVKQAELGNRQAELYYERSKAAMHPSASASVSQSLNWNKPLDHNGVYGNYEMGNGTNYSLSSNVTLYNGLKLQNQIRQSELTLHSNAYYTDVIRESVELSILDAYLQVLYARESVKNAGRQIELTEDQLFLAGERLALSAISQADYLQIKSELASEKLTLADTESQLILAKLNLMQLMELPVTSDFTVASPEIDSLLNENRIPDVSRVFQLAMTEKPEIKQAETNEQSALLEEKIAKADLLPSLSLSAGIGTQAGIGMTDYNYFESLTNQISPNVGLSLSVPIYQRKQAKTNIGLARIGAEEAVLNTLNTKNTLRKEVEQAAANVVIAQQQFEASREDFDVAVESMKIADEKFELGMINSVDFLFERTAFILSESKLLQNKFKLIFSYKVLDYYKGLDITL